MHELAIARAHTYSKFITGYVNLAFLLVCYAGGVARREHYPKCLNTKPKKGGGGFQL